MKKIRTTSLLTIAAFLAYSVTALTSVNAQTVATMPTLYNQSGVAVNNMTNTYLSAGWYYLAPGAQASNQVYYYGNGTYYNANTQLYGGSVNDPNGTAGVSLGYVNSVNVNAPGIPNTGAGGNSTMVWTTLVLSGLVTAAGLAYLVNARKNLSLKTQ